MTFQFNHDLLMAEAEREAARGLFPNIYFALDNPSLRERFIEVNTKASAQKGRSRTFGYIAVALAAFSLVLASSEPVFHELHFSKLVIKAFLILAATCGISGVVMGLFGTLFLGRARRWLQSRFAAERLRQFHFQWIVARASEIVAAAKDPALREPLLARRTNEFAGFAADMLDHLEAELSAIIEEEDAPPCWMLPPTADPKFPPADDPVMQELFSAYERLRLKPQLQYTAYRLHGASGHMNPARQAALFSGVAMSCVFIVFALHGILLAGAVGGNESWEPLLNTFGIWAAAIALAIRTLEEGLQPERQIERLRQYRSAVRLISERMMAAESTDHRLAAMREMEEAAYEEMIIFLKSNSEARFLM